MGEGYKAPQQQKEREPPTFGPRYRWTPPSRFSLEGKQVSVFGEALIGGVKGFDSIFPTSTGATRTASALAIQFGDGLDMQLRPRISLRPVEASWIRMQLPNSTSNAQNDLRISTGVMFSY